VADSPDAPTGGPETAPVTLPPAPAPRPLGFTIGARLWWGDAGSAAAAREAPTPPRVVAKLVAMLVLVTVVVWVLFFLTR